MIPVGQPDPMADIKASFFDECDELLEAYQDGLEELSRGGGNAETINLLFRSVHSIKGGAATFGYDALTDCAHGLENTLSTFRTAGTLPSLDEIGELLRNGDQLATLVTAARTGVSTPAPPAPKAPEETQIGFDNSPTSGTQEPTLTFALTPQFDPQETSCSDVFQALEQFGDVTTTLDLESIPSLEDFDPNCLSLRWSIAIPPSPELSTWVAQQPKHLGLALIEADKPPVPASQPVNSPAPLTQNIRTSKPTAQNTAARKPTIRVELDRVDRLINLVGELVINQAMLAQAFEHSELSNNHLYSNGLDDFLRLTRDLQDSVMQIRAQPVKPLFLRMARICRETADTLGKPVDLQMDGAETEIDKTVIERLADPLTHMIRNAVDHGIEPPERRLKAGKSDTGIVKLRAFHRSGQVIVELSDDGGGIDRARVLAKAQEQGILAPNATPTDAEIDALLFHPGLSTADKVSDVSGRGVGMDVVRSAIHALGGRLTVDSVPGQGTRFSIALPLTLAVLDSMIVGVHGHTMVLPLSAIRETLHIKQNDVLEMSRRDGPSQRLLRYDNRVIPLADLGHKLGFADRRTDLDGVIALIVTHEETATSAIIIDEIQEQRQVVIKGLQDGFAPHPCIAAATILGDGSIALIVDPYELTPATAHGSTQATVPLAQTG